MLNQYLLLRITEVINVIMKLRPAAEDPERKCPIDRAFYMLPAVKMSTDAEGASEQLVTAHLLGL